MRQIRLVIIWSNAIAAGKIAHSNTSVNDHTLTIMHIHKICAFAYACHDANKKCFHTNGRRCVNTVVLAACKAFPQPPPYKSDTRMWIPAHSANVCTENAKTIKSTLTKTMIHIAINLPSKVAINFNTNSVHVKRKTSQPGKAYLPKTNYSRQQQCHSCK